MSQKSEIANKPHRQALSGLVKRQLVTVVLDHRGTCVMLTDKGRSYKAGEVAV